MERVVHLLKISLLLACLPASASAVSFSNLNITETEFSVDISGNLPASEPGFMLNWIVITHPTLFTAPGFVLEDFSMRLRQVFPGLKQYLLQELGAHIMAII